MRDAVCTQDDAKMMAGKSGVCVHTKKNYDIIMMKACFYDAGAVEKRGNFPSKYFFSFASFIMIIKP